jgi:hypothetical protein
MDATRVRAAILRDAGKGALLRMRSEIYCNRFRGDDSWIYDAHAAALCRACSAWYSLNSSATALAMLGRARSRS